MHTNKQTNKHKHTRFYKFCKRIYLRVGDFFVASNFSREYSQRQASQSEQGGEILKKWRLKATEGDLTTENKIDLLRRGRRRRDPFFFSFFFFFFWLLLWRWNVATTNFVERGECIRKQRRKKRGRGGGKSRRKSIEEENGKTKQTRNEGTYHLRTTYAPARTLTAKWQFVYSEERTYSNSRTHKKIRRFADVRGRTYANSRSRKNVRHLRTLIRIPIRVDARTYAISRMHKKVRQFT